MPALESLPGKIGPYRPLEKIGEGGMGVVYLARDVQNRTVALKVLGPAVTSDPNARRRLAREVETMRRIRSPNVAEILDADVAGPSPYIATRYVPGRTLDDIVRTDGPLRGAALERLAAGLAAALAAIHAAGVIHRDLKPGNVMLDDGNPVVIDFGIAHISDAATRLTQTGIVMGTPGYLAPEVIEGQSSTGASDVHSWGATVAFAATGRQPYGTGTFQTVFFRVLQGKAELAGIPGSLLPLVTDSLSVNPRQRPSAQALAQRCGGLYARSAAVGGARDGRTLPEPGNEADETRIDGTRFDGTRIDGTRFDGTRIDGTRFDGTRIDGTRMDGTRVLGGPPPGVVAAGAGAAARQHPDWQHGRGGATLPGPETAIGNVADLLPPVDYGNKAVTPREAAAQCEAARREAAAERAAEREAEAASIPEGAHTAVLWACGVMAVALSFMAPVAGSLLTLIVITLLRAADFTQSSMSRRGSRSGGDIFVEVLSAPLVIVRAILATLAKAPFALLIAIVVAALSVVFAHTDTLPAAGGWGAAAAIAWYCLGRGSRGPRRQLRRISHGLFRTRGTMTVAVISSCALAAAAVSGDFSTPPDIWPATSWMLPHLPSFGNTLHSVQKWLLGRAVSVLHLP
ncbi:MAG TPA: protein kinase [Trebonia sp.]|jgi:predicted Ser/Thr protein kinase|nr:protein kinase [Trebonia sp.]